MNGGAAVLEAVPNFSEGRDQAVIEALVQALGSTGANVLDWSADADHHRSVVTVVGPPETVEEAAVAAARVALERIDLRRHSGIHPRIGALDVLPFVPLLGLSMEDARASAWRVGRRLTQELGIPVFFYGEAATPPGRALTELRRGGYEELVRQWPAERVPDLLPEGWTHAGAHPTAGATCVGARRVLLAWNVYVEGMTPGDAEAVAAQVRESGGGFSGLRARAFELPRSGRLQISMNLENLVASEPIDVFRRIEELVDARGGAVVETEIIGMAPDELLLSATRERMRVRGLAGERMLSCGLVRHLASRCGADRRRT